MVLEIWKKRMRKLKINPKGIQHKPSEDYLEKHKTLVILICSCIIIITAIVAVTLKFDLVNIVRVKTLEDKMDVVENITSFEDGTISFSIDGKTINISMDNDKCKYYTIIDGKIVKSSSEEFYDKALFNTLKAAPNSSGNFLYYSVDNYVEGGGFEEIKTSSVTSRYMEVPEGYLIEIYNPNYKKGECLVYFNNKGDLDKEGIYDFYVDTESESIQLVLPKEVEVEAIVNSLVNYLNNL